MDDADRLEAFTVCCHTVMRTWFSECGAEAKNKEGMLLSDWKIWWYRVWPYDLLADYLPVRGKLMRSLQRTHWFAAGSEHVRWECEARHPKSKKNAATKN